MCGSGAHTALGSITAGYLSVTSSHLRSRHEPGQPADGTVAGDNAPYCLWPPNASGYGVVGREVCVCPKPAATQHGLRCKTHTNKSVELYVLDKTLDLVRNDEFCS